MTDQNTHWVSYVTNDSRQETEKCFEGETAERDACIFAQGIDEDGGNATVANAQGETIDHWDGYRIALVTNGTNDSVDLVFPSREHVPQESDGVTTLSVSPTQGEQLNGK